ncbi:MAG: DUF1801 domain-containing protein [Acidimicrobiales bacterium]|nr:DUF1801 domain-containing protein [Acidimicrobiales bacterium]
MDPLLTKLQHRDGDPIVVLGAPAELRALIGRWADEAPVANRLRRGAPFVLAFCRSSAEAADRGPKAARAVADDGVLWMAYPKRASRRYRSDLRRDRGWQPLADLGFEAVRQVAIDGDWSALRFRRAEPISRLPRDPERPAVAARRHGRRRLAVVAAVEPAVEAYLDRLPADRQPLVRRVHEAVRTAVPELPVAMWKGMIGYGSHHHRYASGREVDWFVIGLANRKRYVSLQLCAVEGGAHLAEANAHRLGRVSVGRSCVRFSTLEDIDLAVVAELARRAADLVDEGGFEP